MTDHLDSGSFKIASLSHENSPIGVNPTRPATQIVRVNGPVQNWKFEKVGHNRYLLSIDGYPHTGVLNGKVIASIRPDHAEEWEVTHHIQRNAYTIALVNQSHLGWTVPINLAEGHQVEIKPITSTGVIPRHFLPTQLYTFKKQDDDD